MKNQRLIELAEAMYGTHWKLPLSEALDVNERTVRRWAKGQFPVPERVWSELAAIAGEHAKELRRLANDPFFKGLGK